MRAARGLRAALLSPPPQEDLEVPGFVGELRSYQRAGVGWLARIDDAGLGGCLADDMGLGKTVQLLAFLLLHPHPYSGLLPLEAYPGACHFASDKLPRHMEQFRWLLAESGKRGIRIYLLTWNICLPPKWAKANNLPEFGADTPYHTVFARKPGGATRRRRPIRPATGGACRARRSDQRRAPIPDRRCGSCSADARP